MKYSKQMCLFKIFIGLVYIDATLRCARTTSKYDQPNYSTGEANLHRPGVKSSPCLGYYKTAEQERSRSMNGTPELSTCRSGSPRVALPRYGDHLGEKGRNQQNSNP